MKLNVGSMPKRGQLRYCLQQTLVHGEKCKDTRPDEETYPGLPPSSMLAPDTLCKAKAGSHGVWGEGRTRPSQCGITVGARCHASPSGGAANLRRGR